MKSKAAVSSAVCVTSPLVPLSVWLNKLPIGVPGGINDESSDTFSVSGGCVSPAQHPLMACCGLAGTLFSVPPWIFSNNYPDQVSPIPLCRVWLIHHSTIYPLQGWVYSTAVTHLFSLSRSCPLSVHVKVLLSFLHCSGGPVLLPGPGCTSDNTPVPLLNTGTSSLSFLELELDLRLAGESWAAGRFAQSVLLASDWEESAGSSSSAAVFYLLTQDPAGTSSLPAVSTDIYPDTEGGGRVYTGPFS